MLHGAAFILGIVAISLGSSKKLPHFLSMVAATFFGLYAAMVIQERQSFHQPVAGSWEMPDGVWVPIVVGILAGLAAGAIAWATWRINIVLLTTGLVVLLTLATFRLFEVSPEHTIQVGAALFSAHRVVSAVVLVVAILVLIFGIRRFPEAVICFTSAFLGTLLLLSGLSYFVQRAGSAASFSLLEDVGRIMSEMWEGQCKRLPLTDGVSTCDCGNRCRTEILTWIICSVIVMFGHFVIYRMLKEAEKKRSEEESASLAFDGVVASV
jgi:hypothetical protein